ncbi:hypothetical protein [Luteibacter sp. ME-Dv--P-043b]|uniref:hypothetical protein n=1 Tax=Luteibacter sp. ME-Dv--P-043b TaxID=3040291 RepID=UPI0025564521|nr:hypothetical protein [Luteibacter sp. ME-Dv--P-043b]
MDVVTDDDVTDLREQLLWSVQLSSRYHMRRQAFFERWSRGTAAVGVIFGSSAVGGILSTTTRRWLIGIAGAVTAIMSTTDLVVGTAFLARRHEDLRKRFIALESEIRRVATPSDATVADWHVKRLDIEVDEPPVYCRIILLCENELAGAHGLAPRTSVARWVRWTSHFHRWENLSPKPQRES